MSNTPGTPAPCAATRLAVASGPTGPTSLVRARVEELLEEAEAFVHDLITTTGGPVPLRTVRTELTAAGHRTEIVSRSLTRAFAFERLTLGFTPHFVRVVARGPAAEVT